MTKRLVVLAAVTAGTFALPFTAMANEPSHNVGGERGVVFHDARGWMDHDNTRSMTRSGERTDSGWRYVGGEAVWIYEGRGNRSTRERSGLTDEARATGTPERAPMQRAQIPNDIYHGA